MSRKIPLFFRSFSTPENQWNSAFPLSPVGGAEAEKFHTRKNREVPMTLPHGLAFEGRTAVPIAPAPTDAKPVKAAVTPMLLADGHDVPGRRFRIVNEISLHPIKGTPPRAGARAYKIKS
jgi:hypothetical protein